MSERTASKRVGRYRAEGEAGLDPRRLATRAAPAQRGAMRRRPPAERLALGISANRTAWKLRQAVDLAIRESGEGTTPQPPSTEQIFGVLANHKVDYLLVGGLAVQTHGHIRTTFDVDIYPEPSPRNLTHLAAALHKLEATVLNPGSEHLEVSASMLPRATRWMFDTRHGAVDVLHDPPGAPPYLTCAPTRSRSCSTTSRSQSPAATT